MTAHATDYPTRPIRLITPYAAGGLSDILARQLAHELTGRLGQSVVVENKVGGGGVVGTDAMAKASPDGYTLGIVGQGLASVNPTLYPKLPYDTQRDFVPISMIAKFSMVLVGNPDRPPATVAELIAMARKSPDAISYGSAGNASTAHLTMAMLGDRIDARMLHVPFKGESAAFTEVAGGRVDVIFATVGGALPLIQGNKLRAIAVADRQRNPLLPDVPTLHESGLADFEVFGWYAVVTPTGTPADVVERLSKELMAIGRDPAFQRFMTSRGMEAVGNSPEDVSRTIRDETARWGRIIEKVGITVD
ncbi:MAG: tripartite tricarboxylate transporter substrate-binding protein [Burkholderiaceae bacterium]